MALSRGSHVLHRLILGKHEKKFSFNLNFMLDFIESAVRFIIKTFVCFVALRPKSTAMVIAGRSVHLTTLFPGQA